MHYLQRLLVSVVVLDIEGSHCADTLLRVPHQGENDVRRLDGDFGAAADGDADIIKEDKKTLSVSYRSARSPAGKTSRGD